MRRSFILILIFQLNFTYGQDSLNCSSDKLSVLEQIQKISAQFSSDQLRTCLNISNSSYPSEFWAHEMIGTDLVKKRIKEKSIRVKSVHVGIIDKGWEGAAFISATPIKSAGDHGTKTTAVIAPSKGSSNYNFSSSAVPVIFDVESSPSLITQPVKIFNASQTDSNIHIKNQMGLAAKSNMFDSHESFKKIIENYPLVISAGNNGLSKDTHKDMADHPNAILVGAIEPTGVLTHYSTQSESVTILAPAGSPENNTAISLGWTSFEGTSAAAPIVSSTLADFISVAGETSGENMKKLLKNTALPAPLSHLPSQKKINAVGIVNHYKMFRVAEKLANNNDWPKNAKLLDDPALYNFKQESDELFSVAKELLASEDCKKKTQGLEKLRESFLLNSTEENRKLLAFLYDNAGIKETRDFYATDSKQKLFDLAEREVFKNGSRDVMRPELEKYLTNEFSDKLAESRKNIPAQYLAKSFLSHNAESLNPSYLIILRSDLDSKVDDLTEQAKYTNNPENAQRLKQFSAVSSCIADCSNSKECSDQRIQFDKLNDECKKILRAFAKAERNTFNPVIYGQISRLIEKAIPEE